MASHFELAFTNDDGVRIANRDGSLPLAHILRFSATRVLGDIGKLVIDVSGDGFDQALLRRDNMIQVWHAPAGGVLRLFRTYFLRGWKYTSSDSTGTTLQLTGACTNDLMRRRVVAAPTDTDSADMEDAADDILREVMRDALQNARNILDDKPTRNWPRLNVEVNSDTATSITMTDMSYKALLDTGGEGILAKICKKAWRENRERVYFDIVPLQISTTGITFIFRSYVGMIGADRTGTGLVFSPESGNLADVEVEFDYAGEVNDMFSGKIGTIGNQQMQEDADMDAVRTSQWNSCEGYTSDDEDNTDVRQNAKIERFVGTVMQTDNCIFGRDWDFGDLVVARFKHFEYETVVKAVSIQVDDRGAETISARIDIDVD